jgi:sigma-B regulation protein RsbQ
LTPPSPGTTTVVRRNNVHVSGNPSGRPIVFAHGFGCSQEMWRFVAPQFERDYKVVVFDHVGAGGSDPAAYDRGKYDSLHGYADDVLDILSGLDLTDAVYVGHSVSAMIGVVASIHDPERFGSLVLVGPSPRYTSADDYEGGFSRDDINGLLDTLDANYFGWSETLAPLIAGNPAHPEVGEELTASFCSVDPVIASQFARVTFLSDNRRDLEKVTLPTVILQCSDDIIAPVQVGEYVHAHVPNSQMVYLTSKGHMPHLSDPDQLVREIKRFLE